MFTGLQEAFIFTFIIGLCSLLPPGFKDMLERLRGTGNVCRSRACRQAAQRILHNLDQSVNPCKNFYEFACGNFPNTEVITDTQSKSKSTTFNQLDTIVQGQLETILSSKAWRKEPKPYKTLKKIYSLCMDEATIEAQGVAPAVEFIQKAGGWPVLESHWSEEHFSIEVTEVKLKSLLQVMPITIDEDVDMTPNQPLENSKHTVEVSQPYLGIDRKYLVQGLDNSVVQAYYKYMVDIAVLFGAEVQVARDKLKLALLFNIELAKINAKAEGWKQYTMVGKQYYSLKEMEMTWGYMDWGKLIQGILPPGSPLMDEALLIRNPEYFNGLGQLIKQTPKETVANFMIWRAVQRLVPYLTSNALNSKFELNKVLSGIEIRENRRKTCIDMCAESIGKIKASLVGELIGHPEEVLDEKQVETYYKDLSIRSSNLLEAIQDIDKWQSRNSWLTKLPWQAEPPAFKLNAFYIPWENRISLPAAILQPPYFNKHLPWYLNYGSIGIMIGHEITHGFDHEGHLHGPWGMRYDWWDKESKKNFRLQRQCFIYQYNFFVDKVTLLNINGIATQGENIADNGGLKLAYLAYKKHIKHDEQRLPGLEKYTPDQIFFINTASISCSKKTYENMRDMIMTDSHAPPEFRVNGMMMNEMHQYLDWM